MWDNIAGKFIELISRGTEGSSEGEVLNAVNMFRNYLAARGTTLAEVLNNASTGNSQSVLNERIDALNDMLKTGKHVADYIRDIALLEREISQLKLELQNRDRHHEIIIAKYERKIIELRSRRHRKTTSPKPKPEFDRTQKPRNPKQSTNRPWTPVQVAWIIDNFISIDGDLKTAKRTGFHDFAAIAAFNERFGDNVPSDGGAWRAKTNSIRDWNTQKLLDKQGPEVLEALRRKGWDGKPSTKPSKKSKMKNNVVVAD